MNNIKFVDLQFTKDEENTLDNINITQDLAFLNYYDKAKFENKVDEYVNDIGNNMQISNNVVQIIHRIVKKILTDTNQESAIIWIRTRVDHSRKQFRWHRDGKYFTANNATPIYKFTIALKGDSTPVVVDKDVIHNFDERKKDLNEILNLLYEKKVELSFDLQDHLNKSFEKDYANIIKENFISSRPREGVYILETINNSNSLGTIHSEPLIEKNRLFFAMLPYTQDKCKEWVDKQKKFSQ